MNRPRPPRHPRAPRPPRKAKARRHKVKRATIQRWHKEDGTKASKRESLFADLMLPLLARLIGVDQQQGPFPMTPEGIPKERRIGKEDPRDVVIDVKPEPQE